MNIDQCLVVLAPYAFVRVSQSTDSEKWYAKADLRIKAEGGDFTVDSGFGHNSMESALNVLVERVRNVVVQTQQFKALPSEER